MASRSLQLGVGLPSAAERVAKALAAQGVKDLSVDPSGRRLAGVTRPGRRRAQSQRVVAHIDEQPFSTVRITLYSWHRLAPMTAHRDVSRRTVDVLVEAIRRSSLDIGTTYRRAACPDERHLPCTA